ncbi:MAG TPA: hypothetical protein VL492_07655 [Methylovirgula sp.]|jgi:hypothetical protein|nr:hypothetical protein [Methylovirgula sp.]
MLTRALCKRFVTLCAICGCFVGLCGFDQGGDLSPIPFFPSWQAQNDALCQSYGYPPGSKAYALCRERKDKISHDSHAQGFPDVTPIPLMLFVNPHPAY